MQLRTRVRRVRLLVAFAALLWIAIVATVAPGCSGAPTTFYECDYPIVGRVAHNGHPDACCLIDPCPGHCLDEPCYDGSSPEGGLDVAITEAGDAEAGPACSGICAPIPPDGWSDPQLFWSGPMGTAPQCPADAPVVAYQGHGDLVVPPAAACSPCTCSASAGTCAPPEQIAANGTACDAGAPFGAPFNGPSGWDGTCTAQDALAANPNCLDSTIPCVHSLAAGPVALTGDACMPSATGLVNPAPPTWSQDALACKGNTERLGACADPGVTCAVPPSSGFLVCVYQAGDVACPASYPDKPLVFGAFDDTRGCTSCACGAPTGSSCTATLSVFKDDLCSIPLPLTDGIGSNAAYCFDVPPGVALGSKTVTGLTFQPGTCMPSGGQATGSVDPSGPSTFCCLPASTNFP